MNTTTKNISRTGSVIYTVNRDGQQIGCIHKTSSGYSAHLPSGGHRTVTSIKKGAAWVAQFSTGDGSCADLA
jgi:hypothetical protein